MKSMNIQIAGLASGASGKTKGLAKGDAIAALFKACLGNACLGKGIKQGQPLKIVSSDDESKAVSKGYPWLQMLKERILAKGLQPRQLQLNEKGLDVLQRFLQDAGFSEEQINGLLKKLKAADAEGHFDMADIFVLLDKMQPQASDETDGALFSNMSNLPYWMTALKALGLEDSTIESVMAEATVAGRGIYLGRLAEQLKRIAKENSIVGPQEQKDVGQDMLRNLLADVGVHGLPADGDEIDLDALSEHLETLVEQNKHRHVPTSVLHKNMEHLLQQMQVKSDTTRTSQDFSQGRIGLEDAALVMGGRDAIQPPWKKKFTGTFNQKSRHGNEIDTLHSADQPSGKGNETAIKNLLNKGGTETLNIHRHTPGMESTGKHAADKADTNSDALIGEARMQPGRLGAKAAPRTAPGGRQMPAYMLKQVGRQIIKAVNQGRSQIQIQLKPPSLGRLHLRMEGGQDGMRVFVITERHTTRDILAGHSHELKSVLMDQGIRLEKIDIQVSLNFDQSMAQARQDSRRSNNRRQSSGGARGQDAVEGVDAELHPRAGPVLNRLLDLVA